MIARGSSPRGLSLVTTTRSASARGHLAHQRALAASRSPPQPNTQISRPPRACATGAQRREHLVQRVRACARSRPPPAAPAAADALHAPGHRLAAPRACRGLASSGTPSATSTPSTPSRFATLKRPSSGIATSASPQLDEVEAQARVRSVTIERVEPAPRRSPRQRARSRRRSVARPRARGARELRAERVVQVDHGRARGPAQRRAAPWPARRPPSCRGSRGGRA